MPNVEHEFGNRSTNLKLAVVEQYLRQFTIALRHQFKQLWYIDAFAGTGERVERLEAQSGTVDLTPLPPKVSHAIAGPRK